MSMKRILWIIFLWYWIDSDEYSFESNFWVYSNCNILLFFGFLSYLKGLLLLLLLCLMVINIFLEYLYSTIDIF